jgi:deazaflavin-dependent oxidoreductase (nitroreductase family)
VAAPTGSVGRVSGAEADQVLRRRSTYKRFARLHTRMLVATRGIPARVSPRVRCLVLETVGRRSGQTRRVVLAYLPDGKDFILLASNFGQEKPPTWWLNLQANPDAVVLHSGRKIPVHATELEGEERAAMLKRAGENNKQWRSYQVSMERELPVIRLTRARS